MVYEPVIGLEVHVELKTKSKMFCGCPADFFGKPPNTQTCPVCLGLPGALPVANQEAIRQALIVGLALNCQVNQESFFERKNYFYPDLSKGFQISQYQKPLSVNGCVEVDGQKYRINRAHLEEDTGKLLHEGEKTLIDFNRSGVPLLEIVSEADFHDAATARKYLEKIYEIVRLLGVSEADMEKGSMRLEANVSVQEPGKYKVGGARVTGIGGYTPNPKVELKNINSFRFVEKAINFELERQSEALEAGEKLVQETRGWNEKANKSYVQRTKEEANDYRYFPEPDLPPFSFTEAFLKELKKISEEKLEESPESVSKRLSKDLGLSFNKALELTKIDGAIRIVNEVHVKLPNVSSEKIANLLINRQDYRSLSTENFIKKIGEDSLGVVDSDEELLEVAQRVVANNPNAISDYLNGKPNVVKFLLGEIMRETKGKANPNKARQALEKILAKR
ncbi:MAG: Asp-tRNA(Asn)/Glu-tRNA(Gln) amidotransferase subunit GatB [bacterium]|nr:Asp-tRNA(Asn)/Glu-tRNA(Gln) amidotransferase subunit GatB [bacterium]